MDFEGLKDKAENLVTEHADKVEGAVDKAGDFLGGKVGHEEQIDKATDKIKGLIPGGE